MLTDSGSQEHIYSSYYSVKYVRVPDLLLDLQEARDGGCFKDTLKKYTNPTLLILDEWLLMRGY